MYTVIENPKRMSRKEILNTFQGKWVFYVDLEGPLYDTFETAVPVIVADEVFEGRETGIYKKIMAQHKSVGDWSMLFNTANVFGFSEAAQDGD